MSVLVMLYANRVVNGIANFTEEDRKSQAFIPITLCQAVADVLLENGVDWLVPIEYGGTLAD